MSGLESWDAKAAKQARSLLAEYHDLFSLEKNEIGHTKAAEHVIELKDPFSLEYQKGKDNTVADFLSRMENHLPKEVEEALRKVEISAPGVKAMLYNADTPITERAEGGTMYSP